MREAVQDFVSLTTRIDLTNCDREPIHIPGAVQPHGVLLAVDEESGRVVMASESLLEVFEVAAQTAVGQTLTDLLGESGAGEISALLTAATDKKMGTIALVTSSVTRWYDVAVHRSGGLAIVELEPALADRTLTVDRVNAAMRATVERVERAHSLVDVAQGVAAEMREVTGFDRIWVYRFHPDWHGEIIGESKREDIETWLGMHYPASDIPVQARELFLRNWVRSIPDLDFVPSPLVPRNNPLTGEPLDLGASVLRSVSPIHVQYLKNMDVTASLVISLIHRGKLWGLISGHHYSGPKRVSAGTRSLCELLAQALSLQIGVTDQLEDREYALAVRERLSRFVSHLGKAASMASTVEGNALTELIGADGAVVLQRGEINRVGTTPTDEEIRALAEWVSKQDGEIVESSALATVFPAAAKFADTASGLLAVPLSSSRTDQILWFRGEQKQKVRWAGDPRKPVVVENGTARLHPRGSFTLWEEEARGTSRPWLPIERETAQDVRRAILEVLIRRAEEIATLNHALMETNAQLEESAVELEVQAEELMNQREHREELLESERRARSDAEKANRAKADFLAVMSHELRTPLNAIGGYAQLMSLGVRGETTADQRADLERIQINQRHLLGLINSILNFSKLEAGTVQFTTERVQVSSVLKGLDALIGPQMTTRNVTFTVCECSDTAVVLADEEKLRQILLNLLTNALKFTNAGGAVELSCGRENGSVRISVRDTGRGIPASSLESVFEPFVQVDRQSTPAVDQGVGLGLAISRELARGMNGDLLAESELGSGSLFTLVLPQAR